MKHKLSSVSRAIALAVLSAFIVTSAPLPATADLVGLYGFGFLVFALFIHDPLPLPARLRVPAMRTPRSSIG